MRTITLSLAITAAALLAAGQAVAQADDPDAYRDDYEAGTYGRIRYEENGASVLRAATTDANDDSDYAAVNVAIFPGDGLRTDSRQRVEVQLAGGSIVRTDRGSDVAFLALPDPYADVADNTVLKLRYGALQISAKVGGREEFRIDTPEASVYLLGDGDFRIDVSDRGRTRVLSRRGVAEVVGAGGSVLVRGGTRTAVETGSVPDEPRSFHTFSSDDFDLWTADREDSDRARDRVAVASDLDAYDEVPREVRPYYRELSLSGRWVVVPTYGYVWYPFDRAPGWRPYLEGRWSYGPRGYFWVSSEPWGWAPYHYGRWSWVGGYGWCWIPGSVFGGAWVSWSWSSAYVGWCPLDFWNRPAFYGTLHHGYYDPDCWTFVSYGHLRHSNYRRYAVPVDRVGRALPGAAVVTRPPRVSPRLLVDNPSARERAVREAADNRPARIAPVARDRSSGRPFTEVERAFVRPAIRPARPESVGGTMRDRTPAGRARAGRPGAGAAAPDSPSAPDAAPFPRRLTGRGNDAVDAPARRAPAERVRPPATGRNDRPADGSSVPVERGRTAERNRPPRSELRRDDGPSGDEPADTRDANERRRDMYRRMAEPRVTHERDEAPPAESPREVRRPAPRARPEGAPPPQRADSPKPSERSGDRTAPAPPPSARPESPPPAPQRSGGRESGGRESRGRESRSGGASNTRDRKKR